MLWTSLEKMSAVYDKGKRNRLYRQLRPRKSWVTQTMFGIFWSLNLPWGPSIGFWGIMRREEKLKVRQAVGNNRYRLKEGRELLWTASKDNRRVNQTRNWPESVNKTTFLCLKLCRRKDLPFVQGKPDTLIATLPQQWQQQRAHCWILSWKLLPQKVVGVSTPNVPQHLPSENIGCGCSKECIQMAWWQKNWQDREQWQNLFSRKSENLYKKNFTHHTKT